MDVKLDFEIGELIFDKTNKEMMGYVNRIDMRIEMNGDAKRVNLWYQCRANGQTITIKAENAKSMVDMYEIEETVPTAAQQAG